MVARREILNTEQALDDLWAVSQEDGMVIAHAGRIQRAVELLRADRDALAAERDWWRARYLVDVSPDPGTVARLDFEAAEAAEGQVPVTAEGQPDDGRCPESVPPRSWYWPPSAHGSGEEPGA